MGFVYDLILHANSEVILQYLIDHPVVFLRDCGIEVENLKSRMVALLNDRHCKKTMS